MKIHFIAIGGSAMHNLAIALKNKGETVSGSDDEVFEPSKGRLASHGLLPTSMDWDPSRITTDLDVVILGMHARKDNPELLKAQELGLNIVSYPEYVYQCSENKQRIVVAGSHGKTTITSMIIHLLQYWGKDVDYLVGAQLEGFDNMVRLSDAPVIVIEGDEYFSSPLDERPKFHHYHHHIGIVSGIAWDHYNVYPSMEEYTSQFMWFADSTPKGGRLIFNDSDSAATWVCNKERNDVANQPYSAHPYKVKNGETYLLWEKQEVHIPVFGEHNMYNISAAKEATVATAMLTEAEFYEAIQSFKGASNRLQLLAENESTSVYKDFAHAPSKLKATTNALKQQFPDKKLIGVIELHSFSSLNKDFISQYAGTFNAADTAVVYFNPEVVKRKKLDVLSPDDVKSAFNRTDLEVFTSKDELIAFLEGNDYQNANLALMSSGNFDNIDIPSLAKKITAK